MTTRYGGGMALGPDLDRFDKEPKFPLGTCVYDMNGPAQSGAGSNGTTGGRAYKYVRFASATGLKRWATLGIVGGAGGPHRVSADRSASTVAFGGVLFQETLPEEGDYGWVQVSGEIKVNVGAAAIANAAILVLDTNDDGDVQTMPGGSEHLVFAFAHAAGGANAEGIPATITHPYL